MKYVHSILAAILLLPVLFSSCSEDESQIVDVKHSPLQFELNVKGGIPVSPTRTGVNLFKAFVFIYHPTNPSSPMVQLDDILTDDGTLLYYTPEDNFDRSSSYNVLAVATADVNLQTMLKVPMSETELLDLIQYKVDLGDNGNEYLVSEGLRGVTFNNPSKVINLLRDVCRLDLSVTDKTSNKYKSIAASFEAPDQTYIFPFSARNIVGIPSGATNTSNQIVFTKDANIYTSSCYFFENTDGLTLNIEAIGIGEAGKDTTFNYKVELAKTERNTIYQVNVGLNLTELTVETTTGLNWKGNINDSQELMPVPVNP